MLKIYAEYDRDTIGKIQWSFIAQFHPASLPGVSAATRVENPEGWIGND
jgi:hypothetical protein